MQHRHILALCAVILVVLVAVVTMDTGSDARELSQVTDQTCDANNRCGDGQTCIAFPETDGPRCADQNPHEYYRCPIGTMTAVQESYPSTLLCSPHGILGILR